MKASRKGLLLLLLLFLKTGEIQLMCLLVRIAIMGKKVIIQQRKGINIR